jgi:hypothetical protein
MKIEKGVIRSVKIRTIAADTNTGKTNATADPTKADPLRTRRYGEQARVGAVRLASGPGHALTRNIRRS